MKERMTTKELLEYVQDRLDSLSLSLRRLETLEANVQILYSTAMAHLTIVSNHVEDIKAIRRVVCSPAYNSRKDDTAFKNDLDEAINVASITLPEEPSKSNPKRPAHGRKRRSRVGPL